MLALRLLFLVLIEAPSAPQRMNVRFWGRDRPPPAKKLAQAG